MEIELTNRAIKQYERKNSTYLLRLNCSEGMGDIRYSDVELIGKIA